MEINKTTEDGKAVISVIGEVDSTNADEFENGLKGATDGEAEVILDLAEMEYISSAGLRVLLMVQKSYGSGGAMVIRNTNEEVMDIFNVTGFSKLLTLV